MNNSVENQFNWNYLEISGWILSLKAKKPINYESLPVPWYSYPAIEFIEDKLKKDFKVFEYGIGQSSLWYSVRVFEVLGVEHDPDFFNKVKDGFPQNVKPVLEKDLFKYAAEILKYENEYFDVIVIDGINRNLCAELSYAKLKRNGFIVFDNADREENDHAIKFLLSKGFKRIDFFGLAPSLTWKICTSIFFITDDVLFRGVLPSQKKSCLGISSGEAEAELERRKYLYPKEFEQLIPSVFTVETVIGCNLKCPECATGGDIIKRKKGWMPFEQFKIIADKIRPFCKYLFLHNWGEPMLNKDIFKIIEYASSFTRTNISTNCQTLTEETTERLIRSGVTDLIVSIDGFTQEVYEKYRVGGNVQKALWALKTLSDLNAKYGNKVRLMPQFCVFKHNQHEMGLFGEFCHSIGLGASFKTPYIRANSRYENVDKYTRPRYSDIRDIREAMKACTSPKEDFVILVDGSCVMCCYDHNGVTNYGNIYQQEVLEIWNHPKYKKERWDILTGNAPEYCTENCLMWSLDKPCEEKFLCLFLTNYYPAFITSCYRKYPHLSSEACQKQKHFILSECFGDSDFYSHGLKKVGWNSDDIILNCPPLQQAWARENDFSGNSEIAVEQIRRAKPQIIYMQDMNAATKEFLTNIRQYAELIAGQIATPIITEIPFEQYDVIFSSFPHYVRTFREKGLTAYYQPLAFDPRVLQNFEQRPYIQRPTGCSFVGGISHYHVKSYELLELLAKETPIEFWGYGVDTLHQESAIRTRHHGEAWGKEMFAILSASRITINRHGEVAENYANNMRLFEATGCGTLLITDYKDNLNELFEIGKEVVAYRSPEECAALVRYYLAHPDEAEKIAKAGQERTLRDHTYAKRMEQTAEILERHLRYKREQGRFPMPERISDGHSLITTDQISENMILGWKSEKIPVQQRGLVQNELESMYKGKVTPIFQVLADCLRPYIYSGCSVLEIGCASGYYYEILEYLLNKRIAYTGVDYSQALIAMAKDYYPKPEFYTADGANLPFENERFLIAISSCVLLHVPNYREHIRETVRVAKKIVVAHRTPICRQRPTQYFKKMAYGVETVELCFNENEIVSEFLSHGLKYIGGYQYYTNPEQDRYEVTYIFEKSINRLLKNAG